MVGGENDRLSALLNVHSYYSFGAGTASPTTLVKRAAALGYQYVALTDDLNVSGVVELFQAAAEQQFAASADALTRFFGNFNSIMGVVTLLVQIFLWYFVLPELLPEGAGRWLKRDLSNAEFWTAVLSLGTYTACRVGETLRAGIESISRGQTSAGLSSGLTMAQVYGYILLPVAYRVTVPALTSEFINIFKNSALALTIGSSIIRDAMM